MFKNIRHICEHFKIFKKLLSFITLSVFDKNSTDFSRWWYLINKMDLSSGSKKINLHRDMQKKLFYYLLIVRVDVF